MTKDEIAQAMQDSAGNSWGDEAHFQRFAALVIKPWADQLEVERKRFQELNDVAALGMQHARADERERIIAQNAPEIEKINAYIKTLEKALEDEREACAKVAEEGLIGHTIAKAIRAKGTRPTTVIYSPGELAARGLTHEDVVKLIRENT